jgi:hypothetical protein
MQETTSIVGWLLQKSRDARSIASRGGNMICKQGRQHDLQAGAAT